MSTASSTTSIDHLDTTFNWMMASLPVLIGSVVIVLVCLVSYAAASKGMLSSGKALVTVMVTAALAVGAVALIGNATRQDVTRVTGTVADVLSDGGSRGSLLLSLEGSREGFRIGEYPMPQVGDSVEMTCKHEPGSAGAHFCTVTGLVIAEPAK